MKGRNKKQRFSISLFSIYYKTTMGGSVNQSIIKNSLREKQKLEKGFLPLPVALMEP